MNVTVQKFKAVSGGGKLKGFADVVIGDVLTIRDVRLMDSVNGLFASMPSRKGDDGKYHEVVHIDDAQLRAAVNRALAEGYAMQPQDLPMEWQ